MIRLPITCLLFSLIVLSCGNAQTQNLCNDTLEPFDFCYADGTCLLRLQASIKERQTDFALETGCPGLILDSDFASSLFNLDSLRKSCLCTKEVVSLLYDSSSQYAERIFYPNVVLVQGEELKYDWFFIIDLKTDFGVDALLPFPKESKLKWAFNFSEGEQGFVSTVDESAYDFSTPIYWDRDNVILKDFPVPFSATGDSYKTDCILDTGTDVYSFSIFNSSSDLSQFLIDNEIFAENAKTTFYRVEDKDDPSVSYSVYWDKSMDDVFKKPVLGMELLRRFDVCFDFEKGRAFFRKNDVGDSYDYYQVHGAQISGIKVIPDDNCDSAMVLMIDNSCPAYIAGLRPFDVIVETGGRPFDQSSLFYQQYCRDHKKECVFGIRRGKEKISINFIP